VAQIAADNALTPACHPDLSAQTVPSAEQHNKSDMQFIRDLGRQFDALATVKAGTLLFAPRDATTSISNRPCPRAPSPASNAAPPRGAAPRAKARRRPGPMARPAGRPPQDRLDRRHQPPPPQARLPQRTRRPRRRPAETTRLARASATMEITPYGDPAATPAPA
jgi:hypothetical protein